MLAVSMFGGGGSVAAGVQECGCGNAAVGLPWLGDDLQLVLREVSLALRCLGR